MPVCRQALARQPRESHAQVCSERTLVRACASMSFGLCACVRGHERVRMSMCARMRECVRVCACARVYARVSARTHERVCVLVCALVWALV